MKLVAIIPALTLGGAERSLVKLINAIMPHLDNASIICFGLMDSDIVFDLDKKCSVICFGGASSSSINTVLKTISILRKERPNIILGWSTYANLVAILAATTVPRSKLFISERCYTPHLFSRTNTFSPRRRIVLSLVKNLYRFADVVTANSQGSIRFLRRYVGGKPVYRVLPNIIDVEQINKKVLGDVPVGCFPHNSPRIIAVGRLDRQKGFDILLRALAQVRRSHDWGITIVGEGPESQALRTLAADLCISASIHWVGRVSNPFPLYSQSDLVVVPSRFEGFPNVLLEAMICGKATISADCKTGPRELTQDGLCGILFPVEDYQSLADQIMRLGCDQHFRAALGEAAKESVIRRFGTAAVLSEYSDVFDLEKRRA